MSSKLYRMTHKTEIALRHSLVACRHSQSVSFSSGRFINLILSRGDVTYSACTISVKFKFCVKLKMPSGFLTAFQLQFSNDRPPGVRHGVRARRRPHLPPGLPRQQRKRHFPRTGSAFLRSRAVAGGRLFTPPSHPPPGHKGKQTIDRLPSRVRIHATFQHCGYFVSFSCQFHFLCRNRIIE